MIFPRSDRQKILTEGNEDDEGFSSRREQNLCFLLLISVASKDCYYSTGDEIFFLKMCCDEGEPVCSNLYLSASSLSMARYSTRI